MLFSKTYIQYIQLMRPHQTISNSLMFLLFTWWELCGSLFSLYL